MLVTAVTGSAATGGADKPSSTAPPSEVFTTIVASPVSAPHPVRGADGRRHLAYELEVVNPTELAVTIDRVEIVDPATDDVVGVLEGEAVGAHLLFVPEGGASSGATLGPGGVAFLVMDAALAPGGRVPRSLVHVFSLSLDPDIPELAHIVRIGATDVVGDHPVVIGPPLRGGRWVDVNGCCAELTAHRGAVEPVNGAFVVSQRFAIDFAQLDADGRLFDGPPDELSSYPFYGTDVLSVAAGVVVRIQDGVPDNAPGTVPPLDLTLRTVPGNYVVVDIGGGRFAAYGHLQPGSLTVTVGDRVRRGQVLGLLGNSGNSDLPHLHFQVADGPLILGSDGLPYEFRSFASEGTLANPDEVLGGEVADIDDALAGRHTRQLPLNLQVISFGSG